MPSAPADAGNIFRNGQSLADAKTIEAKATEWLAMGQPKNTEDGTVLRASLAKPHIQSSDRVLDLGAGLMKPLFGMRMNNTHIHRSIWFGFRKQQCWPILTTMDFRKANGIVL